MPSMISLTSKKVQLIVGYKTIMNKGIKYQSKKSCLMDSLDWSYYPSMWPKQRWSTSENMCVWVGWVCGLFPATNMIHTVLDQKNQTTKKIIPCYRLTRHRKFRVKMMRKAKQPIFKFDGLMQGYFQYFEFNIFVW